MLNVSPRPTKRLQRDERLCALLDVLDGTFFLIRSLDLVDYTASFGRRRWPKINTVAFSVVVVQKRC